ncbi:MAG: electron transfer flavoprotein subunit beta/FixA family protein [Candidatus Latescibacteria bacterium]|nr:electron transfer flavoprotein subunit beta/FixA family protein [Candidatus Latescibacterota bacterium]
MDIIVCMKMVPDTSETEVRVDSTNKDILKVRLIYTTNEADNYALETALLLKEKLGGTVTLISVGPQKVDEVLRMGLAKGADRAIRLTDELFDKGDAWTTAKALAQAISQNKYDLVLSGCIASDDGYSQIGPTLAALLKIPSAAYVNKVEVLDNTKLRIDRELEGGILERKEISLPALLTIQTGTNTPRYASIIGIKRAGAKPLDVFDAAKLNLDAQALAGLTELDKMYMPKVESKAQFIQGSDDEISDKLATLVKEKAGL